MSALQQNTAMVVEASHAVAETLDKLAGIARPEALAEGIRNGAKAIRALAAANQHAVTKAEELSAAFDTAAATIAALRAENARLRGESEVPS